MLNNLLWVNLDLIDIKFKFTNKEIKNIEYILEVILLNWNKIIYKYEDGKWIFINIDNNWKIVDKKIEKIIFDTILDDFIGDMELWIHKAKKDYYKMFNYILTIYNYEIKK
jgi:hypothetical protein